MNEAPEPRSPFDDVLAAAALVAVDPVGLGGVVVRGSAGPVRDHWFSDLERLIPKGTPMRRVPAAVADDRLIGGLDLTGTLNARRPVFQSGLLAEADGGLVVLAMAERLPAGAAARIAAAMDGADLLLRPDGSLAALGAGIGVIALDEGIDDDERPAAGLSDRLALGVDITRFRLSDLTLSPYDADDVADARGRLGAVVMPDGLVVALAEASDAFGVNSPRVLVLACRAARASAALGGRAVAGQEDAELAARLVFSHRATRIPAPQSEPETADEADELDQRPEDFDNAFDAKNESDDAGSEVSSEVVVEAAASALPRDLLQRLAAGLPARVRRASDGRAGAARASQSRGRPIGARSGSLRGGLRLDVVETLRAAAPWQGIRRAQAAPGTERPGVLVRPGDIRIKRYVRETRTATIFVVDASGSSALHRLGEAKGAVELVLADCYVRRDRVALIAFRGKAAEVVLPPTGSLTRAKRLLGAMPGGGGTPLASAVDAALILAADVKRRGEQPSVVFLTDGQANVARDGTGGRARAGEEAMAAARGFRAAGISALVLDTAVRPDERTRRFADALGASYLAMPLANAGRLAAEVKARTARG